MTANDTERIARAEIDTTASPEQVWLAFTDPSRVIQWLVDQASGHPVPKDRIEWRFGHRDRIVSHEVREAVPERRLVLASSEGRVLAIHVDVVDGRTRVAVAESGFPEGPDGDEALAAAASGWTVTLAILRLYVERFFGMPRTARFLSRPTKAGREKVWEYFSNPVKVDAWIGDLTQVQKARPYRLRLESGGELTGRFLAVTDRELLLGADQIDGAVLFTQLTARESRAIAIEVVSWRLTAEQMNDLGGVMLSALTRLGQELDPG